MEEKKPFLVDVPVQVRIWIRPECQRRQFEILKQARPSILFVVSDGGRNAEEQEAILENRRIFETEVDWDCQIYPFYRDENQGLYAMDRISQKYIWSKVDRCIFLEDDVIPAVSFFRYCAELLERYQADERIDLICGQNLLGESPEVSADYFFTRRGSIWGYATWKRVYDRFYDLSYARDPYIMNLLKRQTKKNPEMWRELVGYSKEEIYRGHPAGDEFFLGLSMYGQNQLHIVPRQNMICNIGATADAAHAVKYEDMPKNIRDMYFTKVHEMSFPMHHPAYVINDEEFEEKVNRKFGTNMPFASFTHKLEALCIRISHGDVRAVQKAVQNRVHKPTER
jgi:hypothetical protein